jgi:hypothetical protein
LIAAPIALFGGNAALADTAFTKFSFPATGARANRTMPDRLSDIFNVKDYGAYGDYPKPGYPMTQWPFRPRSPLPLTATAPAMLR